MIYEKINLKEYYNMLPNDCFLTMYVPENKEGLSDNRLRKSILLLPGGGYQNLSFREGEVFALRMLGYDIPTFKLDYSLRDKIKYPVPLIEVFAALDYMRKNADKYHLLKDKISICGFSAGGHLAGLACCNHTNKEFSDLLGINLENMKINGCILGYPVISFDYKHDETFSTIASGNEELMKKLSIEKIVNKDFPKTFIVHTSCDELVPIENSLLLAKSLAKYNIFLEMHIYPYVVHGMSVSDRSVYRDEVYTGLEERKIEYNSKWVDLAIHFIKEYV